MTFIPKKGNFNKQGAYRDGDCVTFTFCVKRKALTEILLFHRDSKKLLYTIPVTDEFRIGRVYSVTISGPNWDELCYLYRSDDVIFMDPYATVVIGREKWITIPSTAAFWRPDMTGKMMPVPRWHRVTP